MMLLHDMARNALTLGQHVDIPGVLTETQLKFPRRKGLLSAAFDNTDEIAAAYVTHIDDCPLRTEEVYYDPQYRLRKVYGRYISLVAFHIRNQRGSNNILSLSENYVLLLTDQPNTLSMEVI